MRTLHTRTLVAILSSFLTGACGVTAGGSEATDPAAIDETKDALSTAFVAQADAYVRDGSSASTNFGTATTLLVKNTGTTNSGYNRWIYLRFDLSSVSGTVSAVKLRLFGKVDNTASESHATALYSVPTTTWSETGITWNNKPATGTSALSTTTVSSAAATTYQWDATAYVQSELAAGRKVISLALKNVSTSSSTETFSSREASGNRPTLQVDTTTTSGGSPMIGPCAVFPSTNEWNRDVSSDPVDPNSANYLGSMNASTTFLHPDFGTTFGIPWITVPGSQPKVPMTFDIADESDPGPYPFPPNAPIEGGASSTGDRHVLVLETGGCRLYETWDSHYVNPGWHCGSGAIFNLSSNTLRPDGFTSADAAGLPILPGLVRQSEAAVAHQINHALRFTVKNTQRAFVHPATHFASSSTDVNRPPMGLRVRLKASYDISSFNATARAILTGLKRYGMFVADNGSDWFVTGETNTQWNDSEINQLKQVPASAFEVVKLGTILH
jgi:hypothetical protein